MSTPSSEAGVSVVVPVLDERETLRALHEGIVAALTPRGQPFEIVYVDDGSTDGSREVLEGLVGDGSPARVVVLARTHGQTAALSAGIDHARHDVVVAIDADLQNDPADIPRLLNRLDAGADVVSGWRRRRRDGLVRTAPSRLANWLISAITGVALHDYGCTLKAYRRQLFQAFRLYGEMHRFVPAYCAWAGGRVEELEVSHRKRVAGKSKYGVGLGRTTRVLLDLLTVKFLVAYGTRPVHLFGGVGLVACFAGVVAGATTLLQKWLTGAWVHRNPLILLAVFLFLLGVQCIMLGLLAEIGIRTFHEARGAPSYIVKDVIEATTPERSARAH